MKTNNLKEEVENLQYELSIVLEAMLLLAGVEKNKLEKAVEAYIDCIDEVCQNTQKEGVEEVLEVVEYLKNHHKDLFQ
ncbi:hypothetical protein CSUB8523_1211 [Campylobacter subantarcticus LMG 24377]|uniref:Uncharacterized protein n=2 Tax=Campylobacter subantarcticus TaxID=497724 RepID=A0A0A8HBB6_9BACT|nr:hypothetical protein [Campylobacter subantarcticus]EAJ1260422.1 hypothetical protein [Campylobacter lari]AJC90940.1 hypothetical protein CSUB8521_1105 [Campylobacter subantarcticus LMG 24374]AJC92718.1 hypothetical protein CSUB8523_1211 [Campylobacter subantarcticus LMG 24377]EAL3938140.1 hypothetical protein [Campylobacter lari]MPB99067.1 hypothetical protein [Campylobacter subantarcticus]